MLKREAKKKDIITFGIGWGIIFTILGLLPLLDGESVAAGWIAAALVLINLALLVPKALRLPVTLWMRFGGVMGSIVSRVVLFFVFFIILTPMAVAARVAGKDPLRKRTGNDGDSYWESRKTQPNSLKNQF